MIVVIKVMTKALGGIFQEGKGQDRSHNKAKVLLDI